MTVFFVYVTLILAKFMHISFLKSLGFSDRSVTIYMALLQLGPSSVRKLAEFCDLNRGVVYEDLKWLQEQELVDLFEKENKQFFVAEDPEKLLVVVKRQEENLKDVLTVVQNSIPELKSLHNKGGAQPVARYFESSEISKILEDVLKVCEERAVLEYRIYSTAGIREYLYKGFETFSDVRVAKGIGVKVIAIGEGGELRGLDERKWLKAENATPTYIIMYPGKTAYISLNAKKEAVGVVIENEGVCETQKVIFEELWSKL